MYKKWSESLILNISRLHADWCCVGRRTIPRHTPCVCHLSHLCNWIKFYVTLTYWQRHMFILHIIYITWRTHDSATRRKRAWKSMGYSRLHIKLPTKNYLLVFLLTACDFQLTFQIQCQRNFSLESGFSHMTSSAYGTIQNPFSECTQPLAWVALSHTLSKKNKTTVCCHMSDPYADVADLRSLYNGQSVAMSHLRTFVDRRLKYFFLPSWVQVTQRSQPLTITICHYPFWLSGYQVRNADGNWSKRVGR